MSASTGDAVGPLARLVRAAHADAWELEGRIREPFGGGAARVRGARLMASGIAKAQWNNADVTAADVDLAAVVEWYERRETPWGVRVPVELEVDLGTPLFVKRCMAIASGELTPRSAPGVVARQATAEDDHAALDAALFGGDLGDARRWVEPERRSRRFRHWFAERAGVAVAICTAVRTNGDAGPAVYLTATAGDLDARVALYSAAAADALSGGAAFVHANPDDDADAALLETLGGVEVPGLLVRLVRAE